MDARYLLMKIRNDGDVFEYTIDSLTEQSVHNGIYDGFSAIFDVQSGITSMMGRFTIKLATLWLVMYMYKRLMQLMTTVGLITHLKNIPPPYLQSYLGSQVHFSLKHLLKRYVSVEGYAIFFCM